MSKTWWQKEIFTLEELLLELQQAKKDSEHFWSFAAHQLQHPLAILQEKLEKVTDKTLQKELERQVYELRRQVTIMLQYQQWKSNGVAQN